MKWVIACLLCTFALQATTSAHVLDEYVQAAQITLAPSGARVELRLVPGVEVAQRVFEMIDVDDDGKISPVEELGYAAHVMKDITLEVDGRRAPLVLAGVQFPSRLEMNEGNGAIRLELEAAAALSAAGAHQLSFRNDHLPKLGVYLVNALVPTTSEIKISGQTRDPLQREMQLSFQVSLADSAPAPPAPRTWTAVLMLCLGVVLLFPLSIYLSGARKRA